MANLEEIKQGKEGVVKETTKLGEGQRERALRRRARSLGLLNPVQQAPPMAEEVGVETFDVPSGPPPGPPGDQTAEDLERRIDSYFEKIHGRADFLPAHFLTRGAARARAVCRLTAPHPERPGWVTHGTGFLIGPGLILTNNHVLPESDLARSATARFDYAEGLTPIRVALDPERLFLTNEPLDYTIVGCTPEDVEGIPVIPLLRNPATIVEQERVNIIQHAAGRPKEIAIHDNRVIDASAVEVIRYRTDTEPGSSGSPVFNNEWDLVALHHAGWSTSGPPDKREATNEGIRVSAIVTDVLSRVRRDADGAEHELALEAIEGSSPMLGFFDTAGLGGDDGLEVEVPDFRGDTRFADVGFWNIEHFREDVDTTRLNRVADVVGRLAMDVMGLVEIQAGALDRLTAALADRGFDYGHVTLDVSGSQDLAVLFDRDTTSVDLRDDLNDQYATQLSARSPSGRTAFPREPLFARCRIHEGQEPIEFVIIVLHLKAFGDVQSRTRRRLAAEKLAEIVADLREREDVPVVIGGDYNELLTTDVLDPLTDAPDLIALTADDAVSGAISYVGRSHRSLIDHVIVSNDVVLGEISGDDAAIVRLDQSIAAFAAGVSDHVPLAFRMIYRDEPVPLQPTDAEAGALAIPAGATRVSVTFE